MKIIKCIVDMIADELEGAENYLLAATRYRVDHKRTSDEFVKLAEVELGHAKTLHGEVVRLIEEYRAKNGEPPKEMMAIYQYEHEKFMKKAAQIRALLEECKNS